MEQQYIYWKTGTGCLVCVAGFAIATLVTAGVTRWLNLHSFVVLGLWLALCLPFAWFSFRADRRAVDRHHVRDV